MNRNRSTILPPPFSHNQPTDPPLASHHCVACQVLYALADSMLCATCKEDSDTVRRKVTHYIHRYERTFNIGFKLLFHGDEEFFGGEPVSYEDAGLNTIPTEDDMRDTLPVPSMEEEIVIDITEEDIIETNIEDDMSITYKSNTTDTDEYVKGLVDELSKARKELEGQSK